MLQGKEKNGNGYRYKEANPFPTTLPTYPKTFFFFPFFYEGREWPDILRYFSLDKNEREREREREKILVQRNFCRIFVSIFPKKWEYI